MAPVARLSVCLASLVAVSAWAVPALASPKAAVLRIKSRVAIEDLAANVTDPASPRFGKYYSPEEIRQLAGPTDEDYNDLLNQLAGEGLTIKQESPTHLWLVVEGESANYEDTFRVRYSAARELTAEAIVPSRLNLVESVVGLDETHKLRPKGRLHGLVSTSKAIAQQSAVKAAYGFNALYGEGLTGAGQDIAIATYDGFKISDVAKYYSSLGLAKTPAIDQVIFNGTPPYDEGSAGETELDAEFSGFIAPGARIHVFASSTNNSAGEAQMFTAILDDNRAKIVNYSWGSCEASQLISHYVEMNKIFARAVAQGVNILVASGDTGSACGPNSVSADWPSVSPYIVAVGGTSFHLNQSVLAETAWSCSQTNTHCSGGGVSRLFAKPSWQTNLTVTKFRAYPDVAFNADPNTGESMYFSNSTSAGWRIVGGTSMAAPHWAGLLALLGEARARSGRHPIGFLNPRIYGLSNRSRTTVFNDITTGNNGAYVCRAGWDAVTGWGSPRAADFVSLLTNVN